MAIDPAEVAGSVVAVLTASPAAFAARSIYVNPLDGRNLNRCFPGDCGDMNEALVSFTGIEDTGDPAVDERPAAPIDGVVIFLVSSLAMNAEDPLLALAG